uniref:Uncharacterized protein n=1 Tax=Anopheles maculatus TaxID=74869 RepID=A0A182SE19_9DIPT
MQIKVVVSLWWVSVLSAVVSASDSSCTQIDFDEATLSSLQNCDFMQQFIVKRYDASNHFDPYRPETVHYLSHRWQGLTCGETVNTYSFNEETELRMAYNLVFDSGATLEVRVFDEDRMDSDNKPTLVEVWHTTASTNGWGFFREKLNKTVKQARIQIEANINAGSDLAIEYLTIFNYEVDTEECGVIDEFATTTTVIPATSETTTIAAETTTQQPPPDTTTTLEPTTTKETTTETFITSTTLSTDNDETTTTTELSEDLSTDTTAASTTTTITTTEIISTTTTNAPRDDTSMQPSTSTTQQPHTQTTEDSSISSTIFSTTTTTESAPLILDPLSPKQWLWMTLSAVFAILFVLAASAAIYLCFMNQHLERITARLLDEVGRYPGKKI